jgi:hypothetical protein
MRPSIVLETVMLGDTIAALVVTMGDRSSDVITD